MTVRASLAELAAAEIRLHPAEAVALVSSLCRRYARGELRGVPSPGIIRLTQDGDIVVEGPCTTGEAEVPRMAQLLSDLLPGFDAAPELRPSGGLRIAIARALGSLDLPPYASIDEFADTLDRFAAPDLHASVRCLFRSWKERVRATDAGVPDLTISDVRRARRATGLTLEEIAAAAEVPATVVRELEWGYFRNWPCTEEGRERIVRYARAAGLDEVVVFSIAWPLVEEAAAVFETPIVTATGLVPVPAQEIAIAPRPAPAADAHHHWLPWAVGVAAILLLTIATFTMVREPGPKPPPIAQNSTVMKEDVAPVAPRVDEDVEPVAVAPPVPTRAPVVRPAAAAAPVVRGHRAMGKPPAAAKRSSARRPPSRTKAFFQKELFRIVFR